MPVPFSFFQDEKPLEGVTARGVSASIAVDIGSIETENRQAFGKLPTGLTILIGASAKAIRAAGFNVVYQPVEDALFLRIIRSVDQPVARSRSVLPRPSLGRYQPVNSQ